MLSFKVHCLSSHSKFILSQVQHLEVISPLTLFPPKEPLKLCFLIEIYKANIELLTYRFNQTQAILIVQWSNSRTKKDN